jgi:hypothetical protein
MSVLRPVVELGPAMVVVSGAMSADDVGAFLAQLAAEVWADYDEATPLDMDQALAWVVEVVRDDAVLVSGGLRAEDDSGFRVDPGCCCDLNDWREWTKFPESWDIWLGHGPDAWVEYLESGIRVHADESADSKGYVEFSAAELPDRLGAVRQDLLGFLQAVTDWTAANAPAQEVAFAAALDEMLHIVEPLPWSQPAR